MQTLKDGPQLCFPSQTLLAGFFPFVFCTLSAAEGVRGAAAAELSAGMF